MNKIICAHCGESVSYQYKCSNCLMVLPIIETNPFLLLGVTSSFILTKEIIQDALVSKLLLYHPDRFALADSLTKEIVTKNAAIINEAAKILENDIKRAEVLLSINGFDAISHSSNSPTQDVLVDFLEIQEQIEESVTEDECENCIEHLNKKLKNNYNKIAKAFDKHNFSQASILCIERNFLIRLKINAENKLEGLYEIL